MKPTRLRSALTPVALGAVAAGLTVVLGPFANYQLAMIGAYLCATAGVALLTGDGGMLSLGHGALMAVGAYTLVLVQRSTGLLPVAVLAAVGAAALVGLLLGLVAARLRGPYLAGVTLAVAMVVGPVAALFPHTLGGDQGLHVRLPVPVGVPRERWQAWLGLAAALVTLLVVDRVRRGGFGRRLRAVRDDEAAAALAGIRVGRQRALAFTLSAAAAGLGGAVVAISTSGASPGAYSLTVSLNLLLAVVLGGAAARGRSSLSGAAVGAALVVLLPTWARDLASSVTTDPALRQRLAGNLPLALVGLALVIVCIAAPDGIQGGIKSLRRKVGRR